MYVKAQDGTLVNLAQATVISQVNKAVVATIGGASVTLATATNQADADSLFASLEYELTLKRSLSPNAVS